MPARDVTTCRVRAGQVRAGQALVVQFTSGPPEQGGECIEILVELGECWGQDSDGDSYDCLVAVALAVKRVRDFAPTGRGTA